jgi:predicted AlkP superfamily phosphohydrolase/phosphomutase
MILTPRVGTRKELMRKLLIIGLDGATWTLLRPWIDEGKLPNLARLVREGASGNLRTTIPPVSASAWVSFATGCNPGAHGAFDFVFPRPGSYDIGVVNVTVRAVPPFWKVIEQAGGQVGLASVPITYPPQPVNGWTVCGFLVPNETVTYTYPPELKQQIKQAGLTWPLHEFEGNRSRDPRRFLQDMRYFDEKRTEMVTWLMKTRPWDMAAFVIKSTDTTQHEIWHLLDPQHPRHDAAMAAQARDDIVAYYQAIDACVGRLVEATGPDAGVIVVSDHGAGPFEKFFHTNNWLARQGYLKFKRAPLSLVKRALFALGFTPITALKLVNLLRLGKFRKNVKRGRGRGWMGQLFLSLRDVDWSRTRAFSIGNFGQIYINVKGQRPKGIVEPGGEYQAVRDEIIQAALALRDPDTGDQVIAAAYKREELYHGARLEQSPDIILHTDRAKYVSFGHADFGSNKLIEPSIGQTGHHMMDGIVILHGQGVKPGARIEGANIMDIAPTALAMMELPVPGGLDGRVLETAFAGNVSIGYQVADSKVEESATGQMDNDVYSEEDEAEVMERLRDLGYVA